MDKKSLDSPALDSVLEKLRKSHLRVTEPRKAILRCLTQNHGPFSAEDMHKRITRKVCDLATVYRILTSLESVGVIRRCEFGDGIARYELTQPEDHHHHHVICTQCKKVEPLDDCELDEIDRIARRRGFADVSHSLEFFGLCPACK